MSIRVKLVVLAVVLVALFGGLLIVFNSMEKARLEDVFRAKERDQTQAVNNIFILVGNSLETFAYDYTYWDEMADFVGTKDKAWAAENIETPLSTYKANAAWVYSADKSLTYSVNNLDDAYLEKLPVPAEAFDILFANKRFCHFFMNTPKGLLEIRGATIHPTNDPDRKTDPRGYFFVSRIWDDAFLKYLSGITRSKVRLVPESSMEAHKHAADPGEGVINVPTILNDWKNSPIVTVETVMTIEAVGSFKRISRQTLLMLAVYSIFALLAVGSLLFAWVNRPLDLITKTLASKDVSHIEGLAAKKDEFGRMAALVKKFFEQKGLLSRETAGRERSEDALKASEEKFSSAFYSVPLPLVVSLLDSGVMVDVNNAFLEMFGYRKEEMVGRSSIELGIIKKEDREKIKKAVSFTTVFRGEIRMRTRSGEERIFDVSSNVIKLNEGECLLSSLVDMTAKKRSDAELKKKMDELEQFNKIAVGRELRMMELKERIAGLEDKLKDKT